MRRIHRQAGLAYLGLGLAVIAVTFAGGLAPAERASARVELLVGTGFIVLFAWGIGRGWWPVTALLTVTNTIRSLVFAGDAFGAHFELLPPRWIAVEPRPLAFVNALLMAVIVVFLARSARAGHRARRRREADAAASPGS